MPLPAGFCVEKLDEGLFRHFDNVPCVLYELEVDDTVYIRARQEVNEMLKRMESYRFNIIGLLLCRLNIPYKRRRHYFCSQFVSEVLARSNALKMPKHTALMRPNDYTEIEDLNCLFKGKIGKLKTVLMHNSVHSA
jgi:inositol transport system substrate-binding protein